MQRKVKIGTTKKRVHHKKTTHRRKRRVSGSNDLGGSLMKVVGLAGGAVAGRELNTILAKVMPSIANSPLLSGALQVAVGYMLPKVIKGKPFLMDIGAGMMANGGMVMVVSTGIISGVSDKVSYLLPNSRMNGTRALPIVSGTNALPVVNGAGLPTNRTNRPMSRKFRTVIPA